MRPVGAGFGFHQHHRAEAATELGEKLSVRTCISFTVLMLTG